MRTACVVVLAVAAAGCHDFDAAPQVCLANGVCRSNIDDDAGTYGLVLDPPQLTLGPGGIGRVLVKVVRPKNTNGVLDLAIDGPGADAGVGSVLALNKNVFSATTLAVQVPLPFAAGSYPLRLTAFSEGSVITDATLGVTVTPAAPTLLVDDDLSADNQGKLFELPSADDQFYRAALKGPVDTFVVPTPWDGGMGSPLALGQVAGYTSIVWFTGQSFGITNHLTPSDRATLLQWLDLGGKRLILAAPRAPSDVGGGWTMATDPLLRDAIGAAGSLLRTGQAATVRNANTELALRANDPIRTDLALLNLRPGTQALMTTTANPDDAGVREIPVASLRNNVGDAGTSTVAFIGFPLVNATDAGAAAAAFDAIRALTGIP